MKSESERRRDVRTNVRLPIELADGDQALSVSSLNIGAGGVYVEVPRFIEPLTKLSLSMMIPGPTPEEEASLVETDAIVVRVLPERADPRVNRYEIACAFLDLSDEHRDIVNRYILTHRVVAT
ncbi:MAG: PilZ domain-containing protein [bacterium]